MARPRRLHRELRSPIREGDARRGRRAQQVDYLEDVERFDLAGRARVLERLDLGECLLLVGGVGGGRLRSFGTSENWR